MVSQDGASAMLWKGLSAAGILVIGLGSSLTAAAAGPGGGHGDAGFADIYGQTLPPTGYVEFCRRYAKECQPQLSRNRRVSLTPDHWKQLTTVNEYVNAQIRPVTDAERHGVPEYWDFPVREGDCEDFVLLKRQYLISMGWPSQALLVTVVLDENGDGHAVLTAVTDRGEYILDNQRPAVEPWRAVPYRFLKRQSAGDPLTWVSLDPNAPPSSAPIAGRNQPANR